MSPGSTYQRPKKTDDSYGGGGGRAMGGGRDDKGKTMGGYIKPEGAKNPADSVPPLLILNIYWCL